MDRDETFTLQMFIRVHGFGLAHAADFPADSLGGELFATISAVIAELRGHAASQSATLSASREGTKLKGVALEALQEDLEAIARTARAIALNSPGFDDKFRLPRNVGEQKWLATARAIAEAAAPFKQEFIRRGLPANFLEELNADIADVEEAIEQKDQHEGAGVAATASVDDAVARGLKIVRELHAIVRNTFRQDPATLAEWVRARHIERAPRRQEPQTPTPQPTP